VIRLLMILWIAAALGAYTWHLPAVRDRRAVRREIRAARDQVRHLHSGHVDDLPRTGGPAGGERDDR
jgi:hypothetical protein